MSTMIDYRKREDDEPWYRQFWPWFLIALPGTVVIAGIATVFIAVNDWDGVVEDDYYKQGLAINQDLAKLESAKRLGMSAELVYDRANRTMALNLAGGSRPNKVIARFLHPTRSSQDIQVAFVNQGDGRYIAQDVVLEPVAWHVYLQSQDGNWALRSRMVVGSDTLRLN